MSRYLCTQATKAVEEAAVSSQRLSRMSLSVCVVSTIDKQNQLMPFQFQTSKLPADPDDLHQQLRRMQGNLEHRDKEITSLRSRIFDYEKGVYGLNQAVQEIKELKTQLSVRDSETALLTKKINELNKLLDAAVDENAAYRAKLGQQLEGTQVSKYRSDREQEIAKLKAENKVLLKENDSLEEERVRLKKQVIHMSSRQPDVQNGSYVPNLGHFIMGVLFFHQ